MPGMRSVHRKCKEQMEEKQDMIYQIYFSPTGGTKKVSDILCRVWNGPERTTDLMRPENKKDWNGQEEQLSAGDLCIVAVPSFGGRVPEPAADRLRKMKGNGARAVLAVVYGNREFDDTLVELKDILDAAGFVCAAAVAAVAEHSILRQFAAGRPDAQDEKELTGYASKIKKALDSGKGLPELSVPGNRPYREYHGVPFKPEAGRSCNRCGKCAEECPVQAILVEHPEYVDKGKCISCMHCISACPVQARRNNRWMLFMAGRGMKKKCAGRKENYLFPERL